VVGVPVIPAADMFRRLDDAGYPRQSRLPWILTGVALAVSIPLALWAGWTLFRR
jgi:hypothetical protein